ncbi:MAG: DUF4982 domain-containing protein [Clostridia bacterium]|nr:DUF4982 domain-containing protein [Clostridia bacterium]
MKKIDFCKDWLFSLNGEKGVMVDLPHDFSIDRERRADAPSSGSGGFFLGGVGKYEKRFMPKKNKKYALMCDGSFGITEVFINENLVYINKYGYNTFVADLTDYLRYGEENLITVKVNNKWQPNARWYTGSGLYRDVFLCESDRTYLDPYGPFVYTDKIVDKTAYMGAEIRFFSEKIDEGVVEFDIFEDGCRTPCHSFKRYVYAEAGENVFRTKFQLDEPKIWDLATPNMYSVKATLVLNGVKDSDSAPFGVRSIIADCKKGLLLNGKSIKLLGGCIHHDNGPIGTCSYAESEYRRIAKLKEAGFNAVRLSHNPQSQQLYDACDRLGMLVIDELFDYWTDGKQIDDMHMFFHDNYIEWTHQIIRRNRCHPSIIMWSTGNEIPQKTGRGYGYRYALSIADTVRKDDHSRPLTHGFCGFFNHKEDLDRERAEVDFPSDVMDFFTQRIAIIADSVDVLGYNYLEYRLSKDLIRFPDKLFINTETFPLSAFTTYTQYKDEPRILGDFVWTAWDYFGETGIGHINFHYPRSDDLLADRYPNHIANCGDIDITGQRRVQSYYREIAHGLRNDPYIACTHPSLDRPYTPSAWGFYECESTWCFPGYEGQSVKVYAFADCDEIILSVNGKEVGRQNRNETGIYAFDTIYKKGEITAQAVNGGVITGTYTLKTEKKPHHVSLIKERSYLADTTKTPRENIVYVEVSIRDENGSICTQNSSLVEYRAKGAEIIGIASGYLLEEEIYTSKNRKLHKGKTVVVLKKTDPVATLSAKTKGFKLTTIDI